MKIKEAFELLKLELLKVEDSYFAKKEALLILAHFLNTSPLNIYLYFDKDIAEKEVLQILKKRLAGYPLAYVLKEAWFWGRKFFVEEGVLIPRQDTEILVEAFLESKIQKGVFLELGVGSGAIAITLLLEKPDLSAFGVDISSDALRICQKNSDYHGVNNKLFLLKADWLGAFRRAPLFSAIISNPPYISQAEWNGLAEEVKKEPYQALVAGETGLEYHEKLVKEASQFLKPEGFLFFEIGYNQKHRVEKLLKEFGWSYQFYKDLSGYYRVVKAWRDEDLRN